MRDSFELTCKILGLVLVCGGILVAVNIIPRFFDDYPDEFPFPSENMAQVWNLLAQNEKFRQLSENARAAALRHNLLALACMGLLPVALGVYLMKPNNVFLRLCYPVTARPDAALPAISVPENDDSDEGQRGAGNPERSPEEADVKYAPPGYNQ